VWLLRTLAACSGAPSATGLGNVLEESKCFGHIQVEYVRVGPSPAVNLQRPVVEARPLADRAHNPDIRRARRVSR
jgi:hypothetical protein